LQPFDIAYIICKNLDYSGLSPGGFLLWLISYNCKGCYAMIEHNIVCLKFTGDFIVNIWEFILCIEFIILFL